MFILFGLVFVCKIKFMVLIKHKTDKNTYVLRIWPFNEPYFNIDFEFNENNIDNIVNNTLLTMKKSMVRFSTFNIFIGVTKTYISNFYEHIEKDGDYWNNMYLLLPIVKNKYIQSNEYEHYIMTIWEYFLEKINDYINGYMQNVVLLNDTININLMDVSDDELYFVYFLIGGAVTKK